MSEVKNNHVQISKFLMRPFAHKTTEGYKVFYLDFQSNIICEEKISILGTIPEYYYPETEQFLAHEVESKVGDILALFKKVSKTEQPFSMTNDNDKYIRRLFKYSFLRSEGVKRGAVKESTYLQFLCEKDQTELLFRVADLMSDDFDAYFNDFYANILINKSSINFVIPYDCVYSVRSIDRKGLFFWCMPISPRCCATLIPKNQAYRFLRDGVFYGLVVDDDNKVREFNYLALASENTSSKKFIIGDVDELERLSPYLRIMKEMDS